MRQVDVELAGHGYPILIGARLLADLERHLVPLGPSSILIVTDPNVDTRYGAVVRAACARVAPAATVLLPDGEAGKTMQAVQAVIDAAVALRADRRSVVLALGGGVVGDIAGFAAAVFMRGIRFVQVPTTLLAQVDSSVGGKTGVNHPQGKNLIGAFHQPQLVLADLEVLQTLPARELSAGLAEVIKHGLLADADYFFRVEANLEQLRACDPAALTWAIGRSCEIKAGIVARDERESGERALLNLGHTFGHAIEAMTGFGRWLHGEAVGCGLCLAADLSHRLGLIGAADMQRVKSAVDAAGLLSRIEGLGLADAIRSMRGDKKAQSGRIGFIVLERIGKARQQQVPDDMLEQTLIAGGFR